MRAWPRPACSLTLAACEGPPGADGTDGADGATGEQGASGNDGADGTDGTDGADTLVEFERTYQPGFGCDQGYDMVWIGVDDGADGGTADDGVLQDGEIDSELVTCLAPDLDEDGWWNSHDNCAEAGNVDQGDSDLDGRGDACDESADNAPMWAITKGSSDSTSSLYRYNAATGVAELVGDTGHALITLQVNPADGLLYAVVRGDTGGSGKDAGGWDNYLVTLDTATGAATQVVEMDVGPIPSLAFLQDGSAYGWTEDGDYFLSIDTDTGETVGLTDRLSSWGHNMGATAKDEVIWVNGGGTFWDIATDGEMMEIGVLDSWLDGAEWNGEYDNGVRGDITPNGRYWVGSGITYGDFDADIVTVRMDPEFGPVVINEQPSPSEGLSFHAMTWSK